MRRWFLTSTTYGSWLPGDRRGSVTSVRDSSSGADTRIEHNHPGESYESAMPGLHQYARSIMKGPAVYLDREKAEVVLMQFRETAAYRGWNLLAVSIMFNHFHLVVEVAGDPAPGDILGDFKSYAARVLNRRYGRPLSGTWWTADGSRRIVRDESALRAIREYVLEKQPDPLVVWRPETPAADAAGSPPP